LFMMDWHSDPIFLIVHSHLQHFLHPSRTCQARCFRGNQGCHQV
jgi:hypothetical protein